MHDIKTIRDDPAAFGARLARRMGEDATPELIAADTAWRQVATTLQAQLARRNEASKAIGLAKSRKDETAAEQLMAEVSELKRVIAELEDRERALSVSVSDLLAALPNVAADDVPDGTDETANVLQHERGARRNFGFTPREHFDIGPALGMDFESAQKVAGARFAYLRGDLARLARALGQFMLDLHTGEHGYQEVAPPLLVRQEAMFGTGQLPKMFEDSFRTTDGRWLIPTSEVSLTNIVAGDVLSEAVLPLRLTALTPCFRSEAGAAGRDTRGLIRQHQFDKVELVSITAPETSDEEHERMTLCAETVLDRLGLPFRRMLLCAGDMGFSARRTYDLEVWLPGQQAWREISSCSTCGDFQARRMNARCRPEGQKGNRFVHTLNGSGVAVGRALVAILETYQNEDGTVDVPEALAPYMGGLSLLTPR